MAHGIAFSVYGESLIIMVQNYIIIWLIWTYNKNISFLEKVGVFVFFSVYGWAMFSNQVFTEQHWQLIQSSNTVMSKFFSIPFTFSKDIVAKIPQIWSNFKMKSTG